MTKKKKDYSKAILERIVGTKSKTYLADEFKKAFAEKYGSISTVNQVWRGL